VWHQADGNSGIMTLASPITLARSPVRYHRSPPELGADDPAIRAWLAQDDPATEAWEQDPGGLC
jgi:hypothetical protein